jgi:flagellar basal-body rod protein FlgG
MNDAMYIAATGMQAQQMGLNLIANNVANVNTPGFKRSTVHFHDLVHREASAAALQDTVDLPAHGRLGAGVSVGSVSKMFSPGDIKRTDRPLDVAIQGEGFFEVMLADGSSAYSRGGSLQVNADNLLATAEGHVLKQRFQIPPDSRGLTISPDGEITATDSKSREWNLGRVELVTFANPSALQSLGDNVYRAGPESGESLMALPGEAGAGRVLQGQLESSNVKLIDEMVQLMVAQRAYEMNVKVIQAADEIASMTNSLRK